MHVTKPKPSSVFNESAKANLSAGQELNQEGLIWRKLSNGTGSWRYDFRLNRKRFKGTLGKEQSGMTLSAARKKFMEVKARATLEPGPKDKVQNLIENQFIEDVAEDYLEWAKVHLNGLRQIKEKFKGHLLPYFRGMRLNQIATINVENFKTHLIGIGLSDSTIKKLISHLSQVFEYARKSDASIENPTKGVSKFRVKEKEISTLSDAEVQTMLACTMDNSRNQAIVGLAALAGLRASEILGLEWKNIDMKNREIRVCQRVVEGEFKKMTKSGKFRMIPIGKQLFSILENHKKLSNKNSFVISTKNGDHFHHIQKLFGQIKNLVSFEYQGGIHILRHTFATNAIKKDVDLPTVQLWMGHSDIKTTMRYVHIDNQHSAEKMKLLD